MQDDIFLAFLDGHRERLLRLRRLRASITRTRNQIEKSRLAVAYSRLLLTLPVAKLHDNEHPPPPSKPN